MSVNIPGHGGDIMDTQARRTISAMTNIPAGQLIRTVDANVEAALPPGCVSKGIFPHGSAYWSQTAAIAADENGQPRRFFLKVVVTEVGRIGMISEYTAIKIIHDIIPGFTPLPIAAGSYASDPNVHFLLLSYEDMSDDIAEPEQLCAKLAELHLKAISPNGKFGFPVDTGMGACFQPNEWTSSWEKCFSRIIDIQFQTDQDVHGSSDEMRELHTAMLEKVIPRLLRPLETDGRSILPCFVHGDLWDGNASVNMANDQAIVFDTIGLYAHNEYELGMYNIARHRMDRAYIREYQRHIPPSAPEEDFDDRIILYRFRVNLASSMSYLDDVRLRELCLTDMRYLCEKYKDGYQGSASRKSESDSGLLKSPSTTARASDLRT